MIIAILAAATLSQGEVREVIVSGRPLNSDQPLQSAITVVGTGEVERTADFVAVTGEVEAEALDQQAALKAMSALRDNAQAKLEKLADAKAVKVETGEIGFVQIRPAGCDETEGQPVSNKGRCAPTSVRATVKLTATVWPADKVGQAASLAVQVGLKNVQLGESGADDDKAMQADALRAAYADARSQAELLAQASGRKLGPLLSITRFDPSQFGEDRALSAHVPPPPRMAVAAAPEPIKPDVALNLTTPKVLRRSIITAQFAFDR